MKKKMNKDVLTVKLISIRKVRKYPFKNRTRTIATIQLLLDDKLFATVALDKIMPAAEYHNFHVVFPKKKLKRLFPLQGFKKDMKKCKENWKTIPYTSEHLWTADIHGIPSGPCVKCGYPTWEWNDKMVKLAKRQMEKDPSVFIRK